MPRGSYKYPTRKPHPWRIELVCFHQKTHLRQREFPIIRCKRRAAVLAPLQKDLDAKNTDDSSNKPAKQKISKAAAEGTLGDRNMANHLITQCPMRPVTAKERFHEVSKGALGLLQELQIINSNRFNKFIPSSKWRRASRLKNPSAPFPHPTPLLHFPSPLPPHRSTSPLLWDTAFYFWGFVLWFLLTRMHHSNSRENIINWIYN